MRISSVRQHIILDNLTIIQDMKCPSAEVLVHLLHDPSFLSSESNLPYLRLASLTAVKVQIQNTAR